MIQISLTKGCMAFVHVSVWVITLATVNRSVILICRQVRVSDCKSRLQQAILQLI